LPPSLELVVFSLIRPPYALSVDASSPWLLRWCLLRLFASPGGAKRWISRDSAGLFTGLAQL